MSASPPWACHYVLYMSTSRCAVLSGERKQPGLRGTGSVLNYWSRSDVCRDQNGALCVRLRCVWHSCHGWLWLCGGARIQHVIVDCCFFFRLSLFSSDDSHFHPVPFRLKFLWLELTVLATAKLPINSTQLWQRRGSRKWDMKSVRDGRRVRERDSTRAAIIFPSEVHLWEFPVVEDSPCDLDEWWLHNEQYV